MSFVKRLGWKFRGLGYGKISPIITGHFYHSFNYRDNLYTVTLKPERTAGMAKIISVVPSINVEFVNRVTVSRSEKGGGLDLWRSYTEKLLLKGNTPRNLLPLK